MILVTGASGFVGNAFTQLLERRGIPHRPVSRTERTGFMTVANWETNPDWSAALDGVDTVVHLAGRVHVMRETVNDPLAAFRRSNVDATLNLARQAAERGVRRFVYSSSIKVMAENSPSGRAFNEVDAPAPDTEYGISKIEAERGLGETTAGSGMSLVVVRPPLVYGPGARANFLALATAVQRGMPLPLGLVRNRRSMVFVDNLADFLLTCCQSDAAANQTFLVSDGEDLSTAELVQILARAMGQKAVLLPVPPAMLTVMLKVMGRGAFAQRLLGDLSVDIAKARDLLGWQPPASARDGLARTAQAMFGPAR